MIKTVKETIVTIAKIGKNSEGKPCIVEEREIFNNVRDINKAISRRFGKVIPEIISIEDGRTMRYEMSDDEFIKHATCTILDKDGNAIDKDGKPIDKKEESKPDEKKELKPDIKDQTKSEQPTANPQTPPIVKPQIPPMPRKEEEPKRGGIFGNRK